MKTYNKLLSIIQKILESYSLPINSSILEAAFKHPPLKNNLF